MPEPMTSPFPYGDLADLHQEISSKIPFFAGTTLPQFSAIMNQETGTHQFDMGLSDNIAKQYSHKLNQWMEPISTPMGEAGAYVGKAIHPRLEQPFKDLAGGLPRSLVEMGAIGLGTGLAAAAAPELGVGVGATAVASKALPWLGRGLQAAGMTSMGSGTYEATGSPAAGVVAGGLGGLFPWSAKMGEAAVKPMLSKLFYDAAGVPIVARNAIAKYVEPSVLEIGRNLGMAANMEATIQGTSLASDQRLQNPLTLEHGVGIAGGLLPFMALEAVRIAAGPKMVGGSEQGGRIQGTRSSLEAEKLQQKIAEDAGLEKMNQVQEVQGVQQTLTKPTVPTTIEGAAGAAEIPVSDQGALPLEVPQSVPDSVRAGRILRTLKSGSLLNLETVDFRDRSQLLQTLQNAGALGPADVNGHYPIVKGFGPTDNQIIQSVRPPAAPEPPRAMTTVTNPDTKETYKQYAPGEVVPPATDVASPFWQDYYRKVMGSLTKANPFVTGEPVEIMRPSAFMGDVTITPMKENPNFFTTKAKSGNMKYPVRVLPDTLPELNALQKFFTDNGIKSYAQEQVDKTIGALQQGVEYERTVDLLHKQFQAVLGPEQTAEVLDLPLPIKVEQAHNLANSLEEVTRVAVQGHKASEGVNVEGYPVVEKVPGASLKQYLEQRISEGMPLSEASEKAYKGEMQRVTKAVEVLDRIKADADNKDLSPIQIAFKHAEEKDSRSLEMQRMARLTELEAQHPGMANVVAEASNSEIITRQGAVQLSTAEYDLLGSAYAAAADFYGPNYAKNVAKAKVRFKDTTSEGLIDAAESRSLAKMSPEMRDLRYAQLGDKAVEFAGLRSYILKAVSMKLDSLRLRNRELSTSQSEKTALDYFNIAEGITHPDTPVPTSTESKARLSATAESLKSVMSRDYTPQEWSEAGMLSGKTTVEEKLFQHGSEQNQANQLNAVLKEFRDNHITFEEQKINHTVSLKGNVPWKEMMDRTGFTTEKFMQQYINQKFLPRLGGLLMKAQEVQAPRAMSAHLDVSTGKETSSVAQVLDRPGNRDSASIGAKAWFHSWFVSRGAPDHEVAFLSDIATRMAASFSDVGFTRIGTLLSENQAGLQWKPTAGTGGIVALAADTLRKGGGPNVQTMMAFQTLGHEMFHGLLNARFEGLLDPAKRDAIDNMMTASLRMDPAQRSDFVKRYYEILIPKTERIASTQASIDWRAKDVAETSYLKQHGAEEMLADVAGLWTLGHLSPDRVTGWKRTGDELVWDATHVQQFAKSLYLPLLDLTESLRDFFNETVPLGRAQHPGDVMANIARSFRTVLTDLKTVDEVTATVNAYASGDLAGWQTLMANSTFGAIRGTTIDKWVSDRTAMPSLGRSTGFGKELVRDAAEWMGLGATSKKFEEINGVQPGWFARNVMPSAQLSKLYPQLQPVFDIVRSFRSMANLVAVKIAAPFMATTSKWGFTHVDKEASGIGRILHNPAAAEVVNRIRMDKQMEGRVFTDAEMTTYAKGLSPEDTKAVINYNRAMEEAMVNAMDHMIAYDQATVEHAGAFVLMAANKQMNHLAAIGHSKTLLTDLITSTEIDPLTKMPSKKAQQAAQAIMTSPLGPTATKMLGIMRPLMEQVTKKALALKDKPWYMPEYRSGKYTVAWKKSEVPTTADPAHTGRPGLARFDKLADAFAYKEKLEKMGYQGVNLWDKVDSAQQTGGMNPDLVQRYKEMETAAYEAAKKEFGATSPEYKEFIDQFKFSPGDTVLQDVLSKGVEQFTMKRNLAEGRETVDTVRTSVDYIRRLSTGMAKRFVTQQVGLALRNTDLQSNPKLYALARDHFQNAVNPTGPEWSLLNQVNFAYFMGFNFSSMMIEGTQGLITLIPQITRDTGSIAESYKAWGRGIETAMKVMTSKKYDDPVLEQYVKKAVDEQRIDFGHIQEFYMAEENAIPNLTNLLKGGDSSMTMSDMVKKPLFWYLNSARWLYSQAPRANAYVSFVSLFQLAREKMKMTPEKAYQYAVSTTDATMFGGGAAARPVGMFHLLHGSKAYGAMGLFYSLGSYTYGTIGMMARLGSEAISKSTFIRPEDRSAARKAFGQMLLTQTALGGALSLPFAGATLALIEQFFPEVEAKKGLKDMLAKLGGGDTALGDMISDVALKGAPSRYGNIDLSSRVALSNIMGVSSYNGFTVKNLLGPTGSVIGNLASGVQQIASGDLSGGVETMVPTPFKAALDMINNDGALRDKAGNKLMDPTASEATLYALGFRPKTLTDFRDRQQAVKRSENVSRMEESHFFDKLSQMYIEGDMGGVRQQLQQRQAEQPMFSAVAGARRVIEAVQKRTYPMDLSRTGSRMNAAERQRLAGSGQVTETQRLLDKSRMEAQLGLPGSGRLGRIELSLAQTTDQLMSMSPTLGRQQALMMAEQMLGRQRSQPAW